MKKNLRYLYSFGLLASYMLILVACGDKSGDIAILNTSNSFVQSTAIDNKVDILWVVDDSGSMADNQANLATNFSAFISNFVTRGYDFHMAVTSTSAWKNEASHANFGYLTKFRDGNIFTQSTADNSGVFMISNLTPNLIPTYQMNINVGVQGSGDERPFDSFKQALTDPDNTPYNFRRSDAFMAIIIISDEEDFSRNDMNENQCDGNPMPATCNNLRTVASFETWLDTFTGSVPTDRKYNVSAITTRPGDPCQPGADQHYGVRITQLATDTNGLTGSICSNDFSTTLNQISGRIQELSTQFRLNQIPDVSTIVVIVNGVTIPEDATNGWTYSADNNSIFFHGTDIPSQGASITVNFTPTTLH